MGSLTIRHLEDDVTERLREMAERNGRSVEEEAHRILKRAVTGPTGSEIVRLSRQLFSGDDGIDLAPLSRTGDRPTPDFAAPEFDDAKLK